MGHHSQHKILTSVIRLVALVVSMQGAVSLAQDTTSKTTGKITGRVINENGQPLSHVAITATANAMTQQRLTTTDDSGYFEISGLDPLPYSLFAETPGHYTPPRDPDSTQAVAYHLGDLANLTLIKGGVITGSVTSATGEPLVQVAVRVIMIRDNNDKPPLTARYPLEKMTDDRGIYRIYGLPSGTYVVSAGGRGTYGYNGNAYESDAPTFAPSSSRDTTSEVVVRGGEETGIDIRFRNDPGHAISGVVVNAPGERSSTNILLKQTVNGSSQINSVSFSPANSKGFLFYGLADGEYDVIAQSFSEGEMLASEPVHVTLKGSDLSGITVTLKGLGAISGKVNLEGGAIVQCKQKESPLLSEVLVRARTTRPPTSISQVSYSGSQVTPDKSGDFNLRGLGPGQFALNTVFFARNWYLRSVKRSVTTTTKGAAASRQIDVARDAINLKFGERVSGIIVTLAEGAASLGGSVKLPAGASVPPKLYVHLVPVEKEAAEDVLKYFTVLIGSDGVFKLNNLPPGKYWIVARLSPDNEPQYDAKLRAPDAAEQRKSLRNAAESAKSEIELQPCQSVADFQVPFEISTPKN